MKTTKRAPVKGGQNSVGLPARPHPFTIVTTLGSLALALFSAWAAWSNYLAAANKGTVILNVYQVEIIVRPKANCRLPQAPMAVRPGVPSKSTPSKLVPPKKVGRHKPASTKKKLATC